MQRRHPLIAATALAALTLLGGPLAQAQDKTAIKVGVTAGPHAQILEQVKKAAAKDGLNIQVVEFSDYVQPNAALAAGDLDANSYQHKPYLDQQLADRGYKFSSVASTVTFPIAIYSKKVKALADLKPGARVGIPNDPTNGGRVLLLLQDKGLIKLADGTGLTPSPLDVSENPKNLKFLELEAAQLPRTLADADIAVINTNYALDAGLNPNKDAIAMEQADSPYANVIVVRKADENADWAKALVEAYHDPAVKAFITEKYKGSVIPAW